MEKLLCFNRSECTGARVNKKIEYSFNDCSEAVLNENSNEKVLCVKQDMDVAHKGGLSSIGSGMVRLGCSTESLPDETVPLHSVIYEGDKVILYSNLEVKNKAVGAASKVRPVATVRPVRLIDVFESSGNIAPLTDNIDSNEDYVNQELSGRETVMSALVSPSSETSLKLPTTSDMQRYLENMNFRGTFGDMLSVEDDTEVKRCIDSDVDVDETMVKQSVDADETMVKQSVDNDETMVKQFVDADETYVKQRVMISYDGDFDRTHDSEVDLNL